MLHSALTAPSQTHTQRRPSFWLLDPHRNLVSQLWSNDKCQTDDLKRQLTVWNQTLTSLCMRCNFRSCRTLFHLLNLCCNPALMHFCQWSETKWASWMFTTCGKVKAKPELNVPCVSEGNRRKQELVVTQINRPQIIHYSLRLMICHCLPSVQLNKNSKQICGW